MRIAFDATYSIGRNLSGVGVYSQAILSRLPLAHPEPRYLFCYRPHRFLRAFRTPLPRRCRRSLLLSGWPRAVNLFHALNQRVDASHYRRVVSTFHDLFVLTAEYSTPEFRQRFAEQARRAAERSDLIIAVSQFTADQVESLLKVERTRIRVIPHGCGGVVEDVPATASREQLVLFVGAIQKRKNLLRLVRAFEKTKPNWKLVLAGSTGYGAAEILRVIEESPRRGDIEIPGYLSSDALESLYRRAAIFAFPSLDEGFGMPVLEAMARGVPVLTSDASALREVAGTAANLVNPNDINSIAQGLNDLMGSQKLREQFANAGRAHSAGFTWERTVEQTWAVYRELGV